MNYIGIDNGVTGSIGIISDELIQYMQMPIFKQLNYTKTKSWISRIDSSKLMTILHPFRTQSFCTIERPMVNPGRWKATVSAIRSLEATQSILEVLKIPYRFIDSKEWQKVMLPSNLKKEELKIASLQIGKRLFPIIGWDSFKDADGLLIAEYSRRSYK